jgi:hypothetical protein
MSPPSRSRARTTLREGACKRRAADIARCHGAHYADFRRPSAVTTNDANDWDNLHWRIGVGRDLIDAVRWR